MKPQICFRHTYNSVLQQGDFQLPSSPASKAFELCCLAILGSSTSVGHQAREYSWIPIMGLPWHSTGRQFSLQLSRYLYLYLTWEKSELYLTLTFNIQFSRSVSKEPLLLSTPASPLSHMPKGPPSSN